MLNRVSKKTLLVLGTSGVLALGIAAPAVAWAESRSSQAALHPGRGELSAERQQKLAEALAKELGIDQAKVAEALKKVQEQLKSEAEANRDSNKAPESRANHLEQLKTRLAEAVKTGTLTQAEADAIIKAAENGLLNGGRGPGRPGR